MDKTSCCINSLEDLKPSRDILPELDSHLLLVYLDKILISLAGVSLEEINEKFSIFEDFLNNIDEFKRSPAYEQFLHVKNSVIHNANAHYESPVVLKEKNSNHQEVALIAGLKEITEIDVDDASEITELVGQFIPGFEISEKYFALASLYLYNKALHESRKIKTMDNNASPFYILGKVSRYIYFSSEVLNISKSMQMEFNAIKYKEQEYKKKKTLNAKKGGDKAAEGKNAVKLKLIKLYVKESKIKKKIVKSHFVHEFIKSLSSAENSKFAPTNIHKNLTQTLTDFEKGRISPDILEN